MSVDVSPDGHTVVFDLLGEIYTMPITGGVAHPVTHGEGWNTQPRFSRDGSRIAFISDRDGQKNIWVVDKGGKRPFQVSYETLYLTSSPVWAPDNSAIIGLRIGSYEPKAYWASVGISPWKYSLNETSAPLLREPAPQIESNGEPVRYSGMSLDSTGEHVYCSVSKEQRNWNASPPLLPFTGERIDLPTGRTDILDGTASRGVRPTVSPNGETIAYVFPIENEKGKLHVLNIHSGEDRELSHLNLSYLDMTLNNDVTPGFAFTPDSKDVVFSAEGRIWRGNVASGVVRPIVFRADVHKRIAPLLMTSHHIDRDFVAVKQFTGTRFLRSVTSNSQPVVFSAVGRIWYGGTRHADTLRALTDSSREGYAVDPSMSPDGRWISYVTLPTVSGGNGHLWKIPIGGGDPIRLDTEWPFDTSAAPVLWGSPVWSEDGAGVLVSPMQPGPPVIYFVPEEGGTARLVISRMQTNDNANTSVNVLGDCNDGAHRIRFEEKTSGLPPTIRVHSVRPDGSDDRVEWTLKAHRRDSRSWSPDSDLAESPDCQYAIVPHEQDTYLVDLRKLDTGKAEAPLVVDLPWMVENGTARHLSVTDGHDFQWLDGGNTIAWNYGNRFYRVSLTDVLNKPDRSKWQIDEEVLTLMAPLPHPSGNLLLRGPRIITMRGDEVIEHGDILLTGNTITTVGVSGELAVPVGTPVIDLQGQTVIPGLIDTHVHGVMQPYLTADLLLQLSMGFTTIRDPNNWLFQASEFYEASAAPVPRHVYSGIGISPSIKTIRSLDDAREVVQRDVADGAVALKQYLQPERLQRQWLRIAAGEAGVNMTNEGGFDLQEQLTHIADGFTGTEHGFAPAPVYRDVIQFVARSGTTYTPTLPDALPKNFDAYYEDMLTSPEYDFEDPRNARFPPGGWNRGNEAWSYSKELAEIQEMSLKARSEASARVRATILPGARNVANVVRFGGRASVGAHEPPVSKSHYNLWQYVDGGMTPLQALRCATQFAADNIGYGQDLGSISPGKIADLVVLYSNPLEDIHNTRNIRYVVKGGVVYDSLTLDEVWPDRKPLPVWREDTGHR
jgi:Tol biopolymer transport system component